MFCGPSWLSSVFCFELFVIVLIVIFKSYYNHVIFPNEASAHVKKVGLQNDRCSFVYSEVEAGCQTTILKSIIIHHKAKIVSKIRTLHWLLCAFLNFRCPYIVYQHIHCLTEQILIIPLCFSLDRLGCFTTLFCSLHTEFVLSHSPMLYFCCN